jgi:hypothetical protein
MDKIDILRASVHRHLLHLSLFTIGFVTAAMPSVGAPPAADQQAAFEYQLKAAFLYNLLPFVDWPPEKLDAPDSAFVIGVLGKDPFGGALEAATQGKKIKQHPLVVRHVSSAAEARTCHLLFISRSEDNRLGAIFKELRDSPVLTVGESENFIARGGMINFVIVENYLRFKTNRLAAKEAGVHLKPQLLDLERRQTNRETASLR